MKIVLFNDNPVVQKLVALSAQKSGDELHTASSLEEITEKRYDLLLVDDGIYSDEAFATIGKRIGYHRAMLMVTRGNLVPAGFDQVIKKPFLPADLVAALLLAEEEIVRSGENGSATAILDEEEVQEVRELLEDADAEEVAGSGFSGGDPRRPREMSDPYDFDALEELQWQIEEAVGELDDEELESVIDREGFEASHMPGIQGGSEWLDELDMLDEEELRMAIGEEAAEGLSSGAETVQPGTKGALPWPEGRPSEEMKTDSVEGVAALRVLLEALSDEEVVRSLKGININININFGNNT